MYIFLTNHIMFLQIYTQQLYLHGLRQLPVVQLLATHLLTESLGLGMYVPKLGTMQLM